MRALGYVRVSSSEQVKGGSLKTQRMAILAEVAHRGWETVDIVMDSASAKTIKGRPGLTGLLSRLRAGEADALVVARLDRLSRSLGDFSMLMDQANREGWAIVMLDPPVDMTTPFGRAMAGVAATFAALERELNSQRQLDSYARRKSEPGYLPPVVARSTVSEVTVDRIKALRSQGRGWGEIGQRLTMEGHPAPRGNVWYPRSIAKIHARHTTV
jgi:DNA invertase Pin-like site-specific DNA recombinase